MTQVWCSTCRRWKDKDCLIITETKRYLPIPDDFVHLLLAYAPLTRGPYKKVNPDIFPYSLPELSTVYNLDTWPITYLTGNGYFRDVLIQSFPPLAPLPESPNSIPNISREETTKLMASKVDEVLITAMMNAIDPLPRVLDLKGPIASISEAQNLYIKEVLLASSSSLHTPEAFYQCPFCLKHI